MTNEEILKKKIKDQIQARFSYTDLTYQDIVDKIVDRFVDDPKWKNFSESDLAPMILEMFAGMTDIINYNIERTAEEGYFDTLKRYRSATKLSGNLGYDIQRPIPAKATIKFKIYPTNALLADISNSSEFARSKNLIIPKNTDFMYDKYKFVLAEDIILSLDATMIGKIKKATADSPFEIKEIVSLDKTKVVPTILQGTIKVMEFRGIDNLSNFQTNGLGKSYQTYYINDKTFSNYYGDKDLFGGSTTLVGVGQTYSEAMSGSNRFEIKRRGLIDGRYIEGSTMNYSMYNPVYTKEGFYIEQERFDNKKVVWVKTSAEAGDGKGAEIRFGDGVTTSIGANKKEDIVYVQYLSTEGSAANKNGVYGTLLQIIDTNSNLTPYKDYITIKAEFTSNVDGGGDIESIEKMKSSVSSVFQTFDRLVTKKDYVSFLNTLTSPIDVRNAIAWGEQDELQNSDFFTTLNEDTATYKAIRKLFNVVLYTCIGSLYNKPVLADGTSGEYSPKLDLYTAILDSYNGNYIYPSQNYINIMSQKEVVRQLKLNNMLTDGTFPIENFKFNMKFDSQNDSTYSSFNTFFSAFAYPRYWNTNLLDPTADARDYFEDSTVRLCGVPTTMSWTLDNLNSNSVLPLTPIKDSNYSLWYPGQSLELDINLEDYARKINPNISLDYKRFEYRFNIYLPAPGSPTQQAMFPLYNIKVVNDNSTNTVTETAVVVPLDDNNQVMVGAGVLTNNLTQTIKRFDYNDAWNTSKNREEYAYKMWKQFMESTWDSNIKPSGHIENGVPKEKSYSYTPWGNLANEVQFLWNNSVKQALTGKDYNTLTDEQKEELVSFDKKVFDFNFFTVVTNIESNEQAVTDYYSEGYIESMTKYQNSDEVSKKLNETPGFVYNSIKKIIDGVLTEDFPLVSTGTFKASVSDASNYIETFGELLEVLNELSFEKTNKIRWFYYNDQDGTYNIVPYDDSTDAQQLLWKEFDIYTNWGSIEALSRFCTKTIDVDGTPRYCRLTVDSIDYVISKVFLLKSTIDNYLETSVLFRSGYTYTNERGIPIRIEGNYQNLVNSFVNSASSGIETNYSSFKPTATPNFSSFETELSDGFNNKNKVGPDWNAEGTTVPDWLRGGSSTAAYVNANNDILTTWPTAASEYTSTINYWDWVALRLFYTPYTVSYDTNGELQDQTKDLTIAKMFSNKGKIYTDILGINNIDFYGHFPANDVNIIDSVYSDKITIVNDYLKQKNQLTVKSIYISPIIHQFQIWGSIYINNLAHKDSIELSIKNSIYEWLDVNNDFGKPIYKSNIIEIIEAHPEVVNTNIVLLPYNSTPKPLGQKYYFDITSFTSNTFGHYVYTALPNDVQKAKFQTIVMKYINAYVENHQLNMVPSTTVIGPIPYKNSIENSSKWTIYNNEIDTWQTNANGSRVKTNDANSHYFEWTLSALSANVTERTFLNELVGNIISDCRKSGIVDISELDFTNNKLFFMLLAEIHNDFRPIIGYNMLNTYGDIAVEYGKNVLYKDGSLERPVYRGGYSLNNEIVQLYIETEIEYRGS